MLCCCIKLKKYRISSWREISRVFIKTISLYILASLIMLIPRIHVAWQNTVYMSDSAENAATGIVYYTRFGLQGFSGWGHTILCAIAVVLFWCLKLSDENISYMYFLLLIVGCVCYGRSGLMVLMLVTIVASILGVKYKKVRYIVIIGLFGMLFLTIILIYINYNTSYNMFSWMFEPFVNMFLHKKSVSASSTDLKGMYDTFNIESAFSLLLGEGRYVEYDGSYYKHTDVGFMRPLYFGGLIFILNYYFSLSLLIISASLKIPKNYRFTFIVLIGLSLFLFELKGESYFAFVRVLLLFCCGQGGK